MRNVLLLCSLVLLTRVGLWSLVKWTLLCRTCGGPNCTIKSSHGARLVLTCLLVSTAQDVPSREFWHIRVPSNDNKPVTNSRDTQDVSGSCFHSIMRRPSFRNGSLSFMDLEPIFARPRPLVCRWPLFLHLQWCGVAEDHFCATHLLGPNRNYRNPLKLESTPLRRHSDHFPVPTARQPAVACSQKTPFLPRQAHSLSMP